MFDRLTSDAAAALRSLRRMPWLVAGAIATLAVAVGPNLAVFGLIHRALVGAPAHVVEPGRLFSLGFAAPDEESRSAATMSSTSYVAFRAIEAGLPAVAAAAAFQRSTLTLMIDGDQRNVSAMLVSGGYFPLLGVRPFLGRALGPADDDAGASPAAVVLSHAFWRSVLREDASAVGRRLRIGPEEYEIAGIMPAGFSAHSTTAVDVFVPFAAAMRGTPGWDRQSFRNVAGILVRLAPGQNEAAAAAQAGAAIDRRVVAKPLAGADVAPTEKRVAVWLGALSVLVLIIGLANSAILLLVRGIRGRREVAIRAAMGASGGRLRSQALIEAILIASVAMLVSITLASWLDEAMRRVLFPELLEGAFSRIPLFAAAGAVGVITALVAIAASASQISLSAEPANLRSGTPGASPRTRGASPLLVVQTSLAFVLLAGAGFFGSSLYRLRAQDLGMNLDRVVVVDFEQTSADIADQDAFFTAALGKIAALPGIEMATPIDAIPFAGFNVPPIGVPGRAEPPAALGQLPFLTAATPEYLKILGIRLVEGRSFVAADDRGAPVVLVNQAMARSVWPGESAVGKCIRIGFDPGFNPETFDPSSGPPMPSDAVPCREVIGVVADVRQRSVLPTDGEDRLLQYFVPFSQVPTPPFVADPTRIRGLLLKVSNGEAPAAAIRKTVLGGRTDLPYLRVRPYAQLLDRQMRPWTMGTRLLGLFSALALAVSALGMFAAFAHAIAERRREMAIRIALGATAASVKGLVLREALGLSVIGVGLGVMGAVLGGRALQSMLFGTTPADPLILGASGAVLLVITGLATFLPAHDAAKSDPNVLLRAE